MRRSALVSRQYKSLRFSHTFLPHRMTSRANFQGTGSVARVLLRLEIDLSNVTEVNNEVVHPQRSKSCSVLAASGSLAAAQDTQSPKNMIMVGAGNDLRCRREKGLRITKSGEPIPAKLSHRANHTDSRIEHGFDIAAGPLKLEGKGAIQCLETTSLRTL